MNPTQHGMQHVSSWRGSRSVERFHRPGGRCLEVRVGEGEASSQGTTFKGADIFDPRLHPTFREAAGRIGSRGHSRIQVTRGGQGAFAPVGGCPLCRRSSCFIYASHPVRFGDPSANSAADGQSIAGRPRKTRAVLLERPKVRQRLWRHTPMPTLVPRDLTEWMDNSQSDMQEAMLCGNVKQLLELTSLQGQDDRRHGSM